MGATLHSRIVRLKSELIKRLELDDEEKTEAWEIIDTYVKMAITVGYEQALTDLGEQITVEKLRFD